VAEVAATVDARRTFAFFRMEPALINEATSSPGIAGNDLVLAAGTPGISQTHSEAGERRELGANFASVQRGRKFYAAKTRKQWMGHRGEGNAFRIDGRSRQLRTELSRARLKFFSSSRDEAHFCRQMRAGGLTN